MPTVAHALLALGIEELVICDRDEQRAATLRNNLAAQIDASKVRVEADPASAIAEADGVVNSTPIGMASHPGMAVPAGSLRPDLWVADIIYFPLETALLATARRAGCRTMNGSGMAVHQAAAAFEIFTGRQADADRMTRTFLALGS